MPVVLVCKGCKKDYKVPPARKDTSKYCSRECLFENRYKDNPNIRTKISESLKNKEWDDKKEEKRIEKLRATRKKRGTKNWNYGTATFLTCIQCGLNFKATGKRKHTGKFCSLECRSEFSNQNKDKEKVKYYKEVKKITESQNLSLLLNYDKRGKVSRKEDAYHLDHIFPIIEGYKQAISPEIIGHISNLRFIPALENHKKGCKIEK